MNYEFMITGTHLPPCMPLPRATLCLPVSNTAKVMYACLLDEILTRGIEDCNGIERRMAELTAGNAAGSKEHGRNRRADPER